MSEPLTPEEIEYIKTHIPTASSWDGVPIVTLENYWYLQSLAKRALDELEALRKERDDSKAEQETTMAFYRDEVCQLDTMRAERDNLRAVNLDQERAIAYLRETSERELRIQREGSTATITALEERIDMLRAQLETVKADYAMDGEAYVDAQNQIAALRARCEQLQREFAYFEKLATEERAALVIRCEQLEAAIIIRGHVIEDGSYCFCGLYHIANEHTPSCLRLRTALAASTPCESENK